MREPLVGVAEVQNAPGIALHPHGFVDWAAQNAYVRLTIIKLGNAIDVVAGLGEARYAGAARHRSRSRVVSRQTQLDVPPVAFHELLEMTHAGVHVLLWVEGIGHVQ